MRKRAKRDLLTLAGVIVILGAIVSVNTYLRLEGLKEMAGKMRMALEEKIRSQGFEVINWEVMRDTTGSYRRGATFSEDMTALDERLVNICGFMAPIDEFRNVTNFMLLPTPISCYFCDSPPMRDVIEVDLIKPGEMVEEPIVVGGRMKLHDGKKPLFFYTIGEGRWNEAIDTEEMEDKETSADHQIHLHMGFEQRRNEGNEKELDPGYTAPSTDNALGDDPPPDTRPDTRPDMGGHTQPIDLGPLLPAQKEDPAPAVIPDEAPEE